MSSPNFTHEFSLARKEYERNKNGRAKDENHWSDWSQLPAAGPVDELDKILQSPYAVAKRAFTPWIKKRESDKDDAVVAKFYAMNVKQAGEVKQRLSRRPTSIFGGAGLKQMVGGRGLGWDKFYDQPGTDPGYSRDKRVQKKFQDSSFPEQYEAHCNKEFTRMNRKALGQRK